LGFCCSWFTVGELLDGVGFKINMRVEAGARSQNAKSVAYI